MTHSERMSSVDTTWLRMDGPANLMIIVGVWLLEGPVAVEKVEKQIAEGLLSYRRFRQKVDYTPAGIYWRDDPNFDLAHHIKRARFRDAAASRRSSCSSATSPPSRSIPTTRYGPCILSRNMRAGRLWCCASITRLPTASR